MKAEDYDANIDIYEEELERLNEMLTGMDPTSDEYLKVTNAIRNLNSTKLDEHRCFTERAEAEKRLSEAKLNEQKTATEQVEAEKRLSEIHLNEQKTVSEKREHTIPECVPKILSVLASTALGFTIYKGELSGNVIGSAASTMLGKLKF